MKNMYHAVKEKGPDIGIGKPGEPSADFFRVEYEMNFMLANSPIPQVPYFDRVHICLKQVSLAGILLGRHRHGWRGRCLTVW